MQQKVRPSEQEVGERADSSAWLDSAAGRYLLNWEQARIDEAVADVFGFFAIQCGFSALRALRSNRMPHRILACTAHEPSLGTDLESHGLAAELRLEQFEDLPFSDQSVDLMVLPHGLEQSADPHQVLREVARVLRPEGRVVITGINPISLWGAREAVVSSFSRPLLPGARHMITQPRVRDWLELLSFECERSHYGCYRPPLRREKSLDRCAFLEPVGDRLWPICGAVYLLSAVKRVRSMRLVGPAWKNKGHRRHAAIAAAPRFDGSIKRE